MKRFPALSCLLAVVILLAGCGTKPAEPAETKRIEKTVSFEQTYSFAKAVQDNAVVLAADEPLELFDFLSTIKSGGLIYNLKSLQQVEPKESADGSLPLAEFRATIELNEYSYGKLRSAYKKYVDKNELNLDEPGERLLLIDRPVLKHPLSTDATDDIVSFCYNLSDYFNKQKANDVVAVFDKLQVKNGRFTGAFSIKATTKKLLNAMLDDVRQLAELSKIKIK